MHPSAAGGSCQAPAAGTGAAWYLFSQNSDEDLQQMPLTISPLRSTAKLPRLSYTNLAIPLPGLQSAHAPAAQLIYKPLMYMFNMGLFIIIKRLKASTLAWLWMDGVLKPVKAIQPFKLLCHPSAQAHPTRPLLKARMSLLKPESLVQMNNVEDTSEEIFLFHDTKANLSWIQIMFKYLHVCLGFFFHHCSNVFRFQR